MMQHICPQHTACGQQPRSKHGHKGCIHICVSHDLMHMDLVQFPEAYASLQDHHNQACTIQEFDPENIAQ